MLALLLLAACHRFHDVDDDPSAAPIEPYDPLPLVDPFVGSGGVGFGVGSVNPGALVPFGMVKVGPDTRGAAGSVSYAHCSGYAYDDDTIDAFSHSRGHGIGITDYGAIGLLPRAGFDPATDTEDATREAPFSHDTEEASPGYYAVTLDDDGVRVELTATERAAMQRYTFPSGTEAPAVVLDLGHHFGDDDVVDGRASWDASTGRLTGYQKKIGGYSGRFGGIGTYFAATFDPAPVGVGAWDVPGGAVDGRTSVDVQGDAVSDGMWLVFPAGTTEVDVRLAISYVDEQGAIGNLDAELADGTSFDDVRAAAEDAWREELGTVRVRGGTDEERTIFTTALYHAYQMPTLFADADGRYRGLDGEVHAADFGYYTDFSLWDTFRTLHSWLILARPERETDMARSLVRMAEDGGSLPRWPMAYGYTGGMVGSPADQVLAETWAKGLQDFPADEAFDFAYAQATGDVAPEGRGGIASYTSLGWVSMEDSGGGAALTLEYAWSDTAMARWADALGRPEADVLHRQGDSWKNVWDPAQGFFVGRHADGTFDAVDDPEAWDDDYVEGDAWQYLWMVPEDVPGMIDVQHGGDVDAWLARYDDFWAQSEAADDTPFPDTLYWHGNEPDIHDAWLGSLAGHADASAGPIRWIQAHKYADSPAGLDGNDDGGTLSAWYLWSAIGVFPVAGTTEYAVGAPLFERVEIDTADGTRVIRAPGASDDGMYVQSATLDGAEWTASTFDHADWTDELVLTMGTSPVGWGQ